MVRGGKALKGNGAVPGANAVINSAAREYT